ncbi:MAG: hypothetical protein ACPG47_02135 [Leucothrix sp.]
MQSKSIEMSPIKLPLIEGEFSMMPFDLNDLSALPKHFQMIAQKMLEGIKHKGGSAFFTFHGKVLKKHQTLRRGGPHTDGNYEPLSMTFGGGGWKIGENGPGINTEFHERQYNNPKGGIVLASNFESCLGWNGDYEGMPSVGGDCSGIDLDEPFMLKADTVYYGNNHFIHESLPVSEDVHRVFARITMPENHEFKL